MYVRMWRPVNPEVSKEELIKLLAASASQQYVLLTSLAPSWALSHTQAPRNSQFAILINRLPGDGALECATKSPSFREGVSEAKIKQQP